MSLAILKGHIYNVNHFRSGTKQDGTPYTLLTIVEKDNQPDGRDSNSSFTAKIWDAEITGTPHDKCQIVIEDMLGTETIHENKVINGKKIYFDSKKVWEAKVRVLD